ncbi:MAG: hypothetical protein QM741_05800 [Rudaea sp.]|uniref:hypothetical protein n=1 Tax=Rudaea sp. TaxID=2136325 RepID=UPI0039E31654
MKSMKGTVIAVLLSAAAMEAHAVTPLIWCDGCTRAQKIAKAKTYGTGDIYIGDLTARTFQGFTIFEVASGDATQFDPPPSDLAAGQQLISYYYASPQGWSKGFQMDLAGHVSSNGSHVTNVNGYPNPNTTAWDVAFPGPQQNNFTDWAAQTYGAIFNYYGSLLGDLASIFHLLDTSHVPSVTTEITFNDGSRITLKQDTTTNGKIVVKVVQDSARDSNNNTIPTNRNAVTGGAGGRAYYQFSGSNSSDFQHWAQALSDWGIPISGSGGGTYTCTSSVDDAGVHVSCFKASN